MIASITFFCLCHACVNGHLQTSLGTAPQRWHTIAAPRNIPLGTWVHIETIGWRRVETRTRRDINGWDVYVGDDPGAHRRARRLGRQNLKITFQPTAP